MINGQFDPNAGLASSGIAGTGNDKDGDENKNANADEEMRDVSKKDGGMQIKSIVFDVSIRLECEIFLFLVVNSFIQLTLDVN